MLKPIQFRTRRGHRVFRLAYSHKGERKHSEVYTFRIKRDGKQHDFNLGFEKKAAGNKADEIAAFLAVKTNTIEEAVRRFSPDKSRRLHLGNGAESTIGTLILRYREVTPHLRPATIRDNIGALRRIAAFILGIKPMRKLSKEKSLEWRSRVDALPLEKLTADQIERFRAAMLRDAGENPARKSRAITTSNFYLRAAGSILSTKLLAHYAGLPLPSPLPFQVIRQLPEPPHRYVSAIDAGVLLALAEKELKTEHPGSYLAFLLSLCCGMRRSEIDRLTWEQIDAVNGHIWIKTTDQFTPKARNSESRIDAPPMVIAALEEFKPLSITPPFVLPGGDPTYPPRCKMVFRVLLAWLRKNGVKHVQALHALRKEAGSLMFAQTGSIDQAAEFLRNDPRVALEHYIGRKGRLELKLPAAATV